MWGFALGGSSSWPSGVPNAIVRPPYDVRVSCGVRSFLIPITGYEPHPFTTIHDENFRRHSSCYVTIHEGNSRRIYYSYTRIPGSWHALRPGSEVVKNRIRLFLTTALRRPQKNAPEIVATAFVEVIVNLCPGFYCV